MKTSRRAFLGGAASAAALGARAGDSPAAADPVMVIGGTGRLGSLAVQRLMASGVRVGFTTRSEAKAGMFGPGATAVVADLSHRAGLARAFEGFPVVFMIIANGADETEQGLNSVAAMREAGVHRVVFLSVVRTVPHYVYKIPVERALADSGIPTAILRPNYFFQFDLAARHEIVDEGVYPEPMGRIGVSRIDCRDIVEVAFQRLTAAHMGHHDDELHGPEALSGPAVAALYAQGLGKPVRYFDDLPAADAAKYRLTSERGRKISAFWEAGRARATPAAVANTRRLVGAPLRRFADFVPEAVELWHNVAHDA